MFRSRKRKSFVIPFFIFLNIVVFASWSYLGSSADESPFMMDHFLVSWDSLTEGRYWTLITSAFSHNAFWHLMLNMFVLNSFGPVIEIVIGTKRFLKFYFTAAIISSLGHSIVSAFILGLPDLPALGASGAISGIVLLFALIFPREKILIFGILPLPAIWGALLFVGLDIWGVFAQAEGGGLPIGHGAHLGGAVTGILYYFFWIRKALLRREEFTT
jgi:membrane associated rhomboid family serine protease